MKKVIFITVTTLSVFFCAFLFYKASTDTYMIKRVYPCRVLSKIDNQYDTSIKGIAHHHRDFVLVLSSEGKTFSLDVEPTTWAICKDGDTLFFTIAPYQLDYYNAIPLRWNIWVIIFPLITVCTVIILMVYFHGQSNKNIIDEL